MYVNLNTKNVERKSSLIAAWAVVQKIFSQEVDQANLQAFTKI